MIRNVVAAVATVVAVEMRKEIASAARYMIKKTKQVVTERHNA